MNRLSTASSPYLLQHAHNPVDWYPWGMEAIEQAKSLDKPILLSIGYAACHWCHVMERESFEKKEIADLMNEFFICIKVDREERPDLDSIYMDALQSITGQGGWPLNIFLTPDLKPFYGGTYFPPIPAYGRPSWQQVLGHIATLYREKRATIITEADHLTEHIRSLSSGLFLNDTDTEFHLHEAAQSVLRHADTENGGFGGAPKFPHFSSLRVLIRAAQYEGNIHARHHAFLSLNKMIRGGIYDQVGGGISRYSVDANWLVPHFEKMLYDNAQLLQALAEASFIQPTKEYTETIQQTYRFVLRELTSPLGGFYSSLDADSEGEEGKFYTWAFDDFQNIASSHHQLLADYFGVNSDGNWEGVNILHRRFADNEFAEKYGLLSEDFKNVLKDARHKLFEARKTRIRPGLDNKEILSWNALMSEALLSCYKLSGDTEYLQTAKRNIEYCHQFFFEEETSGYLHCLTDGKGNIPAFADDYAALLISSIQLFTIEQSQFLIERIRLLVSILKDHFYDDTSGMFSTTSPHFHTDVLFHRLDAYDSVTHSANSLIALAFSKAAVLLDDPALSNLSISLCGKLGRSLNHKTLSFSNWALAALLNKMQLPEIVSFGSLSNEETDLLHSALFLPDILWLHSPQEAICDISLLLGKEQIGRVTFYVCQKQTCYPPVTSVLNGVSFIKSLVPQLSIIP